MSADGTVQVENPNVGVYSHVFAVQDEGVSAAVKCTVSTSGAQSNITGCSQVIIGCMRVPCVKRRKTSKADYTFYMHEIGS